jgi:hypothetical protein
MVVDPIGAMSLVVNSTALVVDTFSLGLELKKVLRKEDDRKIYLKIIETLIKASRNEADKQIREEYGQGASHLGFVFDGVLFEQFKKELEAHPKNPPTSEQILQVLQEYDYIDPIETVILRQRLETNLTKSMQYVQSHIIAMTAENVEKLLESEATLRRLLHDLLQRVETPDSAAQHHVNPSKIRGWYYYASDSVNLIGREKELERLDEFCDNERKLSWWIVTGEGGSGKSKLCYEFANRRRRVGWTICMRNDARVDSAAGEHPV